MPSTTPVSSTTTTSMSTSGGAIVLIWALGLLGLNVPTEVSMVLAAMLVPIAHALLKWIERLTGTDLDGNNEVGNGHSDPAPTNQPAPGA